MTQTEATVCPTITAENAHQYRQQSEVLEPFASRWHIDLSDGKFTPRQLVEPAALWWPKNVTADIHLMSAQPAQQLDALIALQPQLVIVHAEAQGNFAELAAKLHVAGIKVGLALLATTTVDTIMPALDLADHVLIFSGNLGYQGGSKANLRLLQKARRLRELKPSLEIGWDGGVNESNAKALAQGGINVLNVGGYIQSAQNPGAAYAKLKALVKT